MKWKGWNEGKYQPFHSVRGSVLQVSHWFAATVQFCHRSWIVASQQPVLDPSPPQSNHSNHGMREEWRNKERECVCEREEGEVATTQ
jgi:hypothetical protein